MYIGLVAPRCLQLGSHHSQPGVLPGCVDGDDRGVYDGQYFPLAAVPAGLAFMLCLYRRVCGVDGRRIEGDSYPSAV
ncbi:hypothetical protein D3C72_1737950 [compost metagenome]